MERDGEGGDGGGIGYGGVFCLHAFGQCVLAGLLHNLRSREHADGEQRYLPILEDKEWLTQTQSFVVSHEGDTVIRLGGLFQGNHPEAEHRRLTVEYTANPLWYAVQAPAFPCWSHGR